LEKNRLKRTTALFKKSPPIKVLLKESSDAVVKYDIEETASGTWDPLLLKVSPFFSFPSPPQMPRNLYINIKGKVHSFGS